MIRSRQKTSFIFLLAALFLALASFFAFNFLSITARAEDSISYADKSDLKFYSAGVKFQSDDQIYVSKFVTNLTTRQNELMNKGVGVINYKLAFIRSEDANLFSLAKQSKDLYWQGVASNQIINAFPTFLNGLTNAETIYKTSIDNKDPDTGNNWGSTSNYSWYTAEFYENQETINTHYYYICALIETYDYSGVTSYTDKSNIVALSNIAYDMTSSEKIENTISNYDESSYFSTGLVRAYHKTMGIYFEQNTEVSFNYKKMNDDTGVIEDVTDSFTINSLYRTSPKIVLSSAEKQINGLTTGTLLNNGDLSSFNVIATDYIYEQGFDLKTQEKIIYRATGYNYEIDNENNKFIINVEYNEIDISGYSINIYDNDPSDGVSGAFNAYSTDIKNDDKNYTVIWNVDKMESLTINARGWSFKSIQFNIVLRDTNFVKNGVIQEDGSELFETTDGIKIYVYGQENLKLICPIDKVDELFNTVEIKAYVELRPDFFVKIKVNYVSLEYSSGNIVKQNNEPTIEGQFSYMKSTNYFSSLDNVNVFLQTVTDTVGNTFEDGFIFNKVSLKGIEGADNYCVPVSITYGDSKMTDTNSLLPIYIATINYDYSALFRITCTFPDKNDDTVKFKAINGLNYTADYFVDEFDVGNNYRVGSFSYNKNHLKVSEEENAMDCTFEIITTITEEKIINVAINYTDEWNLSITYFQQYINEDGVETPFAIKKTSIYSVKVSDYEDIYSLTNDDLKKILPENTVEFCGVRVEKINVKFDGSITYKITLDYTFRTIREIDENGYWNEMQIPLSPYTMWCDYFGTDWSIMFLNNPKKGAKAYFKYTDSVPKAQLYGFFSVAAFEEKHSSIDSWFSTQTNSEDLKVLFKAKEVRGDAFYKFWNNNDIPILGNIMSWFGELFNSDNKLVYSYFFYLDITDNFTESFISNSGSKDFYDTDSAVDNKFGCSAAEGCSGALQILFYVAIAIAALFVLAIVIKIIRWMRN